jgi:hypothetical protein
VTSTATAFGELAPSLGYDTERAAQFAAAWLPAWTANDPASMLSTG